MSVDVAPKPQERRRQAPKHIVLPTIRHLDKASCGIRTENSPSHVFPATPGIRSSNSASPANERHRNSFFNLDEIMSFTPAHRPSRPPITPPVARRPILPAEISLEHALGDMRVASLAKRDPGHLVQDQSLLGTNTTTEKEPVPSSPVASCNPPRTSRLSGSRSQPESSASTPKREKQSRPRSKTVASAVPSERWKPDTSTFRSTAACNTPSSGQSTPRNISISEIPMLNGPIGGVVDVFGLAALQPPRLSRRPRPKARQRTTEGAPACEPPASPQPDIDLRQEIRCGLVPSARTASPAKG
ncbi:hypothetical protein CTheo_2729 [Ceratobasidium theobromae]|uniref:Uncharacterized protein n=1 Tax=Ceratobasidium theobromae TaxID=1582974 RepID=A0A5N5QRL8_9AGAM|nr:hypothetical protein CTheo_2729 [Ceratobasidium theobromae]